MSRRAVQGKPHDPRSFDHLAAEFDFVASRERRADFFLAHLPARRRHALDVGCGSGILAQELAPLFDRVLAVDVSEPMLDLARTRRPARNVEYRRADADDLDVQGPFDAIVSHTTFHHLRDVPATLRRLVDLLAPGGRLLLVDNVSRLGPLPRWCLTAWAYAQLPRDVLRYGGAAAGRMLRFRSSEEWLDHVASDRYLSGRAFRRIYGEALPGASFIRLRHFMGVLWEKGVSP